MQVKITCWTIVLSANDYITRRIKNSQHVFLPANCAKISKVTSGGGNWILRDLGPPEAKAFDRKYSSWIRLWNTTMKNWFRHYLENFISFPLIYRFASVRRVLTELESDNWKHRSNIWRVNRKRVSWSMSESLEITNRFFAQFHAIFRCWSNYLFITFKMG